MMKVDYLDHMGDDLSVVNAARVSFNKHKDVLDESDKKLINYLAKNGHWSPFTHAVVKFRVKAPIFVARQLGKHVVGLAWNEVSRRYVSDEPEFYTPEFWRKRAENVKQGSSEEGITSQEWWLMHYEDARDHTLRTYKAMIDGGVCPEQARMVLPQSTMTEWIWTGSLYAWANVYNQRTGSHAQRETSEVAKQIGEHMKQLFPVSWEALTAW